MNPNKVEDNKSFWKIVKPFLSHKTISLKKKKKTLFDDDDVTDEQKVANTLDDFFSSILTSLNLPESQNATLKAIVKVNHQCYTQKKFGDNVFTWGV